MNNSTSSNSVNNNQGDGGKKPSANSKGGGGGRGGATTFSGQSMSTSGSVGSPSTRSEVAMTTPASDSTFYRLNNLEIQDDDGKSQGAMSNVKKKRGQRAAGGDKSGRGLRQFSMKVCEKVECKGRTTYNEVADELVAEFADPNTGVASPDQHQYDEKNIRRRVYDALNVLMAMDIISKDKKEIQWKGLPHSSLNDIEELKTEHLGLRNRIDKKSAYLEELEEQYVGLQNLIQRNEQLYGSGNAPTGGVALPFILVQTRPHATVEVEISEDMQLVHFDFNSTPFEIHDDNYVLKAMKFSGKQRGDGAAHIPTNGGESSSMADLNQPQISHPSRLNMSGKFFKLSRSRLFLLVGLKGKQGMRLVLILIILAIFMTIYSNENQGSQSSIRVPVGPMTMSKAKEVQESMVGTHSPSQESMDGTHSPSMESSPNGRRHQFRHHMH